jgi:ubiquinone/menaquinone biosynthesis C-methylase UbiE
MPFADHFSDSAGNYAIFRPTYPAEMIHWLATLAPATGLAWDCATGSGQAAVLLAEHFDLVVATDASEKQLRVATRHPRVKYTVAAERVSGLQNQSVDLVTVAQALHWLDQPAFFAEADRVLVDEGVLAVWSYGKPAVEGDANDVLQWFHDVRVAPFWPVERTNVENGYSSLVLPFPEIPAQQRTLSSDMTRDALVGYVGTWSAVRQARIKEGGDPMPEFVSALIAAWPIAGERKKVSWPLALRVCRRNAKISR